MYLSVTSANVFKGTLVETLHHTHGSFSKLYYQGLLEVLFAWMHA